MPVLLQVFILACICCGIPSVTICRPPGTLTAICGCVLGLASGVPAIRSRMRFHFHLISSAKATRTPKAKGQLTRRSFRVQSLNFLSASSSFFGSLFLRWGRRWRVRRASFLPWGAMVWALVSMAPWPGVPGYAVANDRGRGGGVGPGKEKAIGMEVLGTRQCLPYRTGTVWRC
jgi:hypothetical protein